MEEKHYREIWARDFVELSHRKGRFRFAVVLSRPLEGRLVVALRYVEEGGRWRKVATEEASSLLSRELPELRFLPEAIGRPLWGLPLSWIERHFSARERLRALLASPRDPMEERLCRLAKRLRPEGITGSLLVGLHGPSSDFDLLFYQRASFEAARKRLGEGLERGWFREPNWWESYRRRGGDLPFFLYLRHERRKLTKAAFEGTKVDLLLVDPEAERVAFEGGPWRDGGRVALSARCTSADGFAFPARYRLDHPEFSEVLAFSATYFGQALPGERLHVRGRVEIGKGGRRRIIVGSSREARGEWLYTLPGPFREPS